MDGLRGGLGERARRLVTDTVMKLSGIARVSGNGEIIVEPHKPQVDFGGARVVLRREPLPRPRMRRKRRWRRCHSAYRQIETGGGSVFRYRHVCTRIARKSAVHAVESEERAVKALDQRHA